MLRSKSEMKSFATYKKQELYDRLLNSLDAPETSPLTWIVVRTFRREYGDKMGPPTPSEKDIKALTEPIRPGKMIRAVHFEECWDWALGNWEQVIPAAKEILLEWVGSFNQEFVEAVKRIEEKKGTRPGKRAR